VLLTGTIAGIEILLQGRRLTLDEVRFGDDASVLPRRLHVRLRANDAQPLETGDAVRIRAVIRPPSSPAYPGEWDLRRDEFFAGLGGGRYALGGLPA
jgi:competence protein ComEC